MKGEDKRSARKVEVREVSADGEKSALTPTDILSVLRLEVRRFLRAWKGQVDGQDENDLVQWLIERLLGDERKVLADFDPARGPAHAYFGRFARRRLIDRSRLALRRSHLRQENLAPDDPAEVGVSFTPEQWIQYLETQDHLIRDLRAQSSEEDMKIFRMAFADGLTNGQISEQLNTPVDRVASRKHALRVRVRKILREAPWAREMNHEA